MERLDGVRALITGSTSGLGLAMAAGLAEAGARVAVTGRSEDRARQAAADLPGAIGVGLDTRDETSIEAAIDRVWTEFGGIDLLVNNAGIGMRTPNPRFVTHPQGFWEVSAEGFRDVIATNLTGFRWLASADAADAHDERIVAVDFPRWLEEYRAR